ncbi:MAG: transcription-repair coupling factor, partial [Lentisphaeria bacterium]
MIEWHKKLTEWAEENAPKQLPAIIKIAETKVLDAASFALAGGQGGQKLFVTANDTEAENLANVLKCYYHLTGLSEDDIQLVPPVTGLRHEWIAENESARCVALWRSLQGGDNVFITTPASLVTKNVAPEEFKEKVFRLQRGDSTCPPEKLAAKLIDIDYDNELEVHLPGEFARRGGIIDIYSPVYTEPVRLEYFGDEIESIRFFDPETQRSTKETDEVLVIPRGSAAMVPQSDNKSENGDSSFLDYLAASVPLILCFPDRITEHLERFADLETRRYWHELLEHYCEHLVSIEVSAAADVPEPENGAREWRSIVSLQCHTAAEMLTPQLPELADKTKVLQWQLLRDTLRYWAKNNYQIIACCGNQGEADRFRSLLADEPAQKDFPLIILPQPLEHGIIFPHLKLVLLSEHEIFGKRLTSRRGLKKRQWREIAEEEAPELEKNCYAVHAVHGICIYHGITDLEVQGAVQENIELEFAEGKRLFVPLEQAHLVSRYIGGTRKKPALNKLGSSSWQKQKEAAANAAYDLAAELIRIEAMRKKSQGLSFTSVEEWEHDFEAAFPYEETPDQKRAIREVLNDMEKDEPMDRLLCGDVGYGKTEVAMRAAFRAVLNGKQVAVLVPTTLLAQQHYLTFSDRMSEYPVIVDMISRFRKQSEQNEILEKAALGQIDILIGTHRLLNSDIPFADLGLLIVDEEQRFGVKHKEQLKALRTNLDILTMTATPIPRTLYFSLAGLRNLSTIMTPPAERLPIKTLLSQYDNEVIRQAVTAEIERDGQTFFVHNRVKTINQTCDNLENLIPDARFGIAHGQMPTDELEEVMLAFINKEIDVLVCTTIIESGLDIPNANTLIIDNADKFGLAELYQLRGRVGRYRQRAYAYMLIPPVQVLPQNARERLAAIRRYTHLGAGFKLALRDLEIRGAGNLLGHAQSGQIANVGFNLYCQLLRQAVAQLENQPPPSTNAIPVRIPGLYYGYSEDPDKTTAFIPSDYIPESNTRIDFYQRLNTLTDFQQLEDFAASVRDRFGAIPESFQTLIELTRLRITATNCGVSEVRITDNKKIMLKTDSGYLKNSQGHIPCVTTDSPLAMIEEI